MAAPTAIPYNPIIPTAAATTYALIPKLKSSKIVSSPKSPVSKLLFSDGFVSRKPVLQFGRAWNPKTMTGSTKTSVFQGSAGDEVVRALEQEPFVYGPSQFAPKFTAVGIESTLNRASKWLVTALFVVVFLWRRDAEALWTAMGSIVNAGLSVIMKKILNQERPVSRKSSGPGMPSSHAQSIFFAVTFAATSLFEWLGANGFTIALGGLALAFGSYLSWLRVSQQFHTTSQVVVGAVVGSSFSVLWFWLWDAIVLKAFVSYLWARIIVVLGAAGLCLGFVVYMTRFWVMGENQTKLFKVYLQ
ncbi:dolichyldiphosphatase [Sarracenia purpurea var. burkii]